METPPTIKPSDLELNLPQPTGPLLEGPGTPCTWQQCMQETAAQTIYYLKHFGHEPPPPPIEPPFTLH